MYGYQEGKGRWTALGDRNDHIYTAAAAAAAESLQSCLTLCDPTDGRPPGSLSLGLSRQEHWSGLPFLESESQLNKKQKC